VDDGRSLRVRVGDHESEVVGACLSLTSRCNEQCVMCMEERDPARPYDMPLAQALELASLFVGRVPVINSSASEALLYPGFLELARNVRDRGGAMGVVTNGLALVREGFLEECVAAGLRQVMISCHTPSPATFGALTGVPRAYPTFVRALDLLDDHNRTAPAPERITVIAEIVLMRPVLDELEELIAFIDAHLPASRPLLRIESMRVINSARSHPDLALTANELASVVERLIRGFAHTHVIHLRFIPLCMLEGFEHLATEVSQVLRGEKTLGNHHCESLELVEVMTPASARTQEAFRATCGPCPLAVVCPGLHDIPAPVGSRFPRTSAMTLEQVAARLDPPIGPDALGVALERLLAVPPTPDLPAHDVFRLGPLLRRLRDEGASIKSSADHVEVDISDDAQPTGTARVLVDVDGAGLPAYRRTNGYRLTYSGRLTRRVQRLVDTLEAELRGTAPR
jgi:MoaA/NifB/PqqE/SkfB family radical SAM enzyme